MRLENLVLYGTSIPVLPFHSRSPIPLFSCTLIPFPFHSISVRIRGQLVAMLVDTSHPLSRGSVFLDTFQSCQEDTDQGQLQRLLLRSILATTHVAVNMVEDICIIYMHC